MPLGKRSHLRKSTAVFSEISKSMSFSVASGVAEEAPAVPLGKRSHLRKSTAMFSGISKSSSFSVASFAVGSQATATSRWSPTPFTSVNRGELLRQNRLL
ncbi:hypothetical protein AAV98_07830 [Bacillus sp. CHD6a]|nr:hypothetical protein AAV98_07830 [Bacillus sp. CHD6a]